MSEPSQDPLAGCEVVYRRKFERTMIEGPIHREPVVTQEMMQKGWSVVMPNVAPYVFIYTYERPIDDTDTEGT